MRRVTIAALRRIVIHAQGYASRARSASTARGGGGDSPALVRAARLDLGRRAQPPHRARVARRRLPERRGLPALAAGTGVRVLGARGVPAAGRGLAALRARRCIEGGRRWYGDVGETHPHLADEILAEIRARGPLGSRHFDGTSEGGMWNWKPAKAMLDRLWNHGDLVIAGQTGVPAALRPAGARDPARAARRTRPRRGTSACARWR